MRSSTAVTLALLLLPGVGTGVVVAQTLKGVWRGRIEDRGGKPVEFELQVLPSASGAGPPGRLQPVGHGSVTPFVVSAVSVSADRAVRVEVQMLRVVIEGKLEPDNRSIRGTWTQFGSDRQPVVLARIAAATPPLFFDPLVEIRIPKPPTAVRVNGTDRLFYEIHVANFTGEQIELRSVEIGIGEKTSTLEGEALARVGISHGVVIPALQSGGAMIGLQLSAAPPEVLRHRVTFAFAGRTSTLEMQAIPVGKSPARISPPLRGGDWWAGSGPDSSLHHRAAIVPMDGRFAIAQRFAFDFARRSSNATAFEQGDPRQLGSSLSYGAEVLAVADATVSHVRDGVPDTQPYTLAPAVPITKETLGGNLVVLDLGQRTWAVYAHLQPGSIRVRPGSRVRRGDVIARLGNSSSYSPHLHFHVVDGPDPFSSEGVPFVFDEFTHEGKVHRDEMPSGGWTLRFAGPQN